MKSVDPFFRRRWRGKTLSRHLRELPTRLYEVSYFFEFSSFQARSSCSRETPPLSKYATSFVQATIYLPLLTESKSKNRRGSRSWLYCIDEFRKKSNRKGKPCWNIYKTPGSFPWPAPKERNNGGRIFLSKTNVKEFASNSPRIWNEAKRRFKVFKHSRVKSRANFLMSVLAGQLPGTDLNF